MLNERVMLKWRVANELAQKQVNMDVYWRDILNARDRMSLGVKHGLESPLFFHKESKVLISKSESETFFHERAQTLKRKNVGTLRTERVHVQRLRV